jgi:PAS domain S-box-containing protein
MSRYHLLLGVVSFAAVTGLYFWLDVPLVATAFTYLVVLVLLALVSNLSSLIALSFIGVGCLSYFFAPPIYSFRVDYPQDIITISAFVMTSFVINFLVTRVRDANQRLEVTNKALRIENMERKRVEEALRESEHELRQITEAVPGLIWSNGPDGEVTYINQRILDYVGIRFEGFRNRGWEACLHPDDLPETERAFDQAIKTGTSHEALHRVRRSDSEYRWHHARAEPLRDPQGRIVQWYGLSVDVDEGMRAQEALRESERRSRSAIDGIGGLVAIMTPNGAIETVNRQVLEYFGRSPEELKNWGTSDAVHPEDLPHVVEMFTRAMVSGIPYHYDQRLRRFDGEYRWFDNRGVPIRDDSGRIARWYVLITDIEDRKRAEQALRESEAKFRDYAETASDWLWEIGPDYKFTLLSEKAFGSGAADRIGMACWDHALDLETEPEKWRLVRAELDTRKPFRDFVYRGLDGSGSPMYVKASGKPMFDANGEFHGYRGTSTDVSALMRAQEALRESERSARSAIDGIAGLVAVMAPNGELETVNRQVFEYFGRPLEELRKWGTSDAVHPEDLPHVVEIFTRAMSTGLPYRHDQRLRRFDGEYRWFDVRGLPIRDDSGRIARWYVLITDIEDRMRALARLEQMQSDFAHMNRVSMMGELAASLSHEIAQPIGSARNNARAALNFLDMQPPDLSEVREALGCVVGDTERAGDIVDRIRDHIKKTPPRKEHFDLNEAINEVIGLGRSAIVKNGVWVQTRLSGRLFPTHGDRVQLQQVVLNLILNAAEAMGSVEAAPRDLLISTEQKQRGVLVAVRDSGPGIDPAHLERVFEAFYTTKADGVGMGLSICRSIIDAHGGRLWAEVNEPRGAIFQFTLPAGQAVP